MMNLYLLTILEIILKKYLKDNGIIKGYFFGTVLFNVLGLTA